MRWPPLRERVKAVVAGLGAATRAKRMSSGKTCGKAGEFGNLLRLDAVEDLRDGLELRAGLGGREDKREAVLILAQRGVRVDEVEVAGFVLLVEDFEVEEDFAAHIAGDLGGDQLAGGVRKCCLVAGSAERLVGDAFAGDDQRRGVGAGESVVVAEAEGNGIASGKGLTGGGGKDLPLLLAEIGNGENE